MKQNERWLVYAVTGFLALILVVAVLSSRPAENTGDSTKLQGLKELMNPGADKTATEVGKADPAPAPNPNGTGVPDPTQVSPQPLVAQPKAMLAADVVTQALGPSTREFTVRKVWVKQNDSLESLVRRWCGVDRAQADEVRRLVDETKKLNEELSTLKAGTQIVVPWIDDEVLAAVIDAQKPKTLVADAGTPAASPSISALVEGASRNSTANPVASPAVSGTPSFAVPGTHAAGDPKTAADPKN
ncbi:MAG: hypothetical protein JNK15_25485, partial [Planctomycetes bacterium]|nr:hypothetical protein [Planctomycetota bacterium]